MTVKDVLIIAAGNLARSDLAAELTALEKLLVKKDLQAIQKDPALNKHAAWAEELLKKYKFTAKNAKSILQKEVGLVFAKVLEYAGVYKRTPQGQEAFERFLKKL